MARTFSGKRQHRGQSALSAWMQESAEIGAAKDWAAKQAAAMIAETESIGVVTCARCGETNDFSLTASCWTCPNCGTSHDIDYHDEAETYQDALDRAVQ